MRGCEEARETCVTPWSLHQTCLSRVSLLSLSVSNPPVVVSEAICRGCRLRSASAGRKTRETGLGVGDTYLTGRASFGWPGGVPSYSRCVQSEAFVCRLGSDRRGLGPETASVLLAAVSVRGKSGPTDGPTDFREVGGGRHLVGGDGEDYAPRRLFLVYEGSFETAAKVKQVLLLVFFFLHFFRFIFVCARRKNAKKRREERPIQKEGAKYVVCVHFILHHETWRYFKNRPKKSQGKGLLSTSRAPGLCCFVFCYFGKTK